MASVQISDQGVQSSGLLALISRIENIPRARQKMVHDCGQAFFYQLLITVFSLAVTLTTRVIRVIAAVVTVITTTAAASAAAVPGLILIPAALIVARVIVGVSATNEAHIN